MSFNDFLCFLMFLGAPKGGGGGGVAGLRVGGLSSVIVYLRVL